MLHARKIQTAIRIAEDNKHITPEVADQLRKKVEKGESHMAKAEARFQEVWKALERHGDSTDILMGWASEIRD